MFAGIQRRFVLLHRLVTFRSAICGAALSVGVDVREPTGGVPSPRAHLPLLPQSAVPCGAPDVAGRIIHTHTLMKVSIWPHTLTLSPRNHTGTGTPGSLRSPVVVAFSRYGSARYFLHSVHRKARAEAAHS